MRILMTGATGFVGSHLLRDLLKGNTVFVLTRKNYNKERIEGSVDKCTLLNFTSLEELENIFRKYSFDIIIHLATYYKKNINSLDELQLTNSTNIIFPSELLELGVKYHVKAFINTGTLFEYRLLKRPVTEKTEIQPYNYYAATKVAFENILKYYADSKKIRAMTLKLSYVYGEDDNQKIIPLLIDSFLKNKTLFVTKGEQRLNFTYVKDVVEAYRKAIDFISSSKYHHYEIFHVGNNKTYSIRSIIKILKSISRKTPTIYYTVPYAENEIMYMNCTGARAKRILRWKAKTGMIEGLSKIYEYYLTKQR